MIHEIIQIIYVSKLIQITIVSTTALSMKTLRIAILSIIVKVDLYIT